MLMKAMEEMRVCGTLLGYLVSYESTSSADAAHRALGLNELRLADVVASFLLPNDAAQPGRDFVVGSAVAKLGLQIVFGDAEEAGADFAVGGQTDSVAMATEGFAYGRNDAEAAPAIREGPAFGGFGR